MQELYQDESGKWRKRTIADTEKSSEQQPNEESQARWRIAQLEEALRGNDYKIIKCFEASALGAEMPYDLAALHAEREKAREEINDLQQKFNI